MFSKNRLYLSLKGTLLSPYEGINVHVLTKGENSEDEEGGVGGVYFLSSSSSSSSSSRSFLVFKRVGF